MRHLTAILLLTLVIPGAFTQESLKLTPAANQLRKSYEQAVERSVKPLRDRYLSELERLRSDATKAGKLEEAMALKQEIEGIQSEAVRRVASHFLGQWDATHGVINIEANQTARQGGGTATWEVNKGDLILSWSNNYKHRYPLNQVGDAREGEEISPSGKVNAKIWLKRRP